MAYRKTKYVENKLSATRVRILMVARKLVEKGGWRACTLTSVAVEAGVSSGSIYTYFNKISDLYTEVFFEIAKEELAVIAKIARSDGPPSLRLEKAIMAFARRAMRAPAKAYAVIGEPVAAETGKVRHDFRTQFIAEYEHIIAEGVHCGSFRKGSPRLMSTCLLGAMTEALFHPLSSAADVSKAEHRKIAKELSDFCMSAISLKLVSEEEQ